MEVEALGELKSAGYEVVAGGVKRACGLGLRDAWETFGHVVGVVRRPAPNRGGDQAPNREKTSAEQGGKNAVGISICG